MTLRLVPIDDITEDHLKSLITDEIAELRSIEYKQDLPGRSDSEGKEFLADVCSLANAGGGDLVYGIEEEYGVPKGLPGITMPDPDAEILRLEGMILNGLDPRLIGFGSKPVLLSSGNRALVVRIPRSLNRPHAVGYKGRFRFYSRNSAGKYPMDVHEVRHAYVLSEGVADRIRTFRTDRLARVISGETPVPIEGVGRIVFHVVPLSAFDSPASFVDLDMNRPPLSKGALLPILVGGGSPRYNFDGVVCDAQLTPGTFAGYVQLFRSGVVEAADNYVFNEWEDGSTIASQYLEQSLIEAAQRYFRLLRELGAEPPVFLMLSLSGVRGYHMALGDGRISYGARPVDREDLLVPEVLVDSLDQDRPAVERILRPLLDAVWNACRFRGSPNYDPEGRLRPRR